MDVDIEKINALVETDTSLWPQGYVKVYLTNHMSNRDNEACLSELGTPIVHISAKDSARDMHTQALTIS